MKVSITLDEIPSAHPADTVAPIVGPIQPGQRNPGQHDPEQHNPAGAAESATHIVLIPSFNSGPLLAATVAAARAVWAPVWIVIDGSSDNSAAAVEAMARVDPAVRVLRLARNRGKGAAVRFGVTQARSSGFTHVLVMDADGQHPADSVPAFMAASIAEPEALVMGRPVFGTDAPLLRVVSRRLCNSFAALETLRPIGDTLFGFRVYPMAPLLTAMQESSGMRRFDFDPEAVVRIAWQGVPLIHLPAQVRYISRADGGISHFHYLRDNVLLTGMHLRLLASAFLRLPRAARHWLASDPAQPANARQATQKPPPASGVGARPQPQTEPAHR